MPNRTLSPRRAGRPAEPVLAPGTGTALACFGSLAGLLAAAAAMIAGSGPWIAIALYLVLGPLVTLLWAGLLVYGPKLVPVRIAAAGDRPREFELNRRARRV